MKQINIKNDLCDFCGTCVAVCPVDAIELLEARLVIDYQTCTVCLNCVKVCPLRVLELTA
ncbi:MAG: 4Fe-4S binding protein [candidate division KSB1 bacterium]|nr:4Fe-4S binding protein [candidate division KSB1 bacterium]